MLEVFYHPDHISDMLVRIKQDDYDYFPKRAKELGMTPKEFMTDILDECEKEIAEADKFLQTAHETIFGVPYGQEPEEDDEDELEWMEEQFDDALDSHGSVYFPVYMGWWDEVYDMLAERGWTSSLPKLS